MELGFSSLGSFSTLFLRRTQLSDASLQPEQLVELTLEHWELSRDRLESFVSPDPLPLDVASPKDREHAL
jgi:hypothetical protein